ncbi:MAG: Fe-S cluster assembly protein SufD [Alphaproteobacteria bacterium]|nr:Fe-S cluster assembly protein SufD [Alphaproteobacteria bacterium]
MTIERAPKNRNLRPPESYAGIFAEALADLPGAEGHALAVRKAQFEKFEKIGFPGPKVETWKYSPLGPIAKTAFQPVGDATLGDPAADAYLLPESNAIRLVFINGDLDPGRSDGLVSTDEVTIASLGDALGQNLIDAGQLLSECADDRGFDALNGAFADCGAVIRVSAGQAAPKPVQLLFVSTGSQTERMINPRIVIELGDGSSVDLVETHVFGDDAGLLTNLVTRCKVGESATLRHDRLQIGNVQGRFIGRFDVDLGEEAKLVQTLATLGGGFVRNEIAARLNGTGIDAQFNGLYLTRTGQHIDNMLQIDHTAPGSVSDQYYKGVLDGRAKAAFAGKIHVHQAAQQTNAYQTNNNLLLSPDAEINTKPELEIYADDVKCSHGATAGELDERELFYLRSRGLDPETARTMLTFAFADEVLERFASPHLLEQAKREMLRWLPGGDTLADMDV